MFSVLHIECSNRFKEKLKKGFYNHDIHYHHSNDSDEVFKLLEEGEINLVITEMGAEKAVKEFIENLNKNYGTKHIPMLVITNQLKLEQRKRLFDLGIVDICSQDTKPEKIVEYVHNIMQLNTALPNVEYLNVAVIENNKADIQILKNILSRLNFARISYYKSEKELLKKDRFYDIYFVDFVSGQTTGKRIIGDIRKNNKDAIIIAISDINNYKVVSDIVLLGIDDFILKPFSRSTFIARLKKNLENFNLKRELEKKNKMIDTIAVSDGLTGLYNHNYIFEMLFHEIIRVQRYKSEMSIMILNIDFFKNINDTYGHLEGDNVLSKIANVIKSCLRKTDMVGRYGGEEFLLLLPETNLDKSAKVGEKIRKKIKKIDWDGKDISITVTGGVVQFNNESAISFVNRASELVIQGKENGRNRIEK
jgi:two-component system cell cycle response regulator